MLSHYNNQIRTILILSTGTFLEYFDLMLYVHMSVVLNNIFFPKYSEYSIFIISAFAFCSTYILRPFGALIFGHIGDKYGRLYVLFLTTSIMALSSFTIAILPSYSEIGIAASIIITICRMLQGVTCSGEKIGAEIYLTENIPVPYQYFAVTLIDIAGLFGTLSSLCVAYIVTKYNYSGWRYIFMFGTIISIISIIIRNNLKDNYIINNKDVMIEKKPAIKTYVSMFFIQSSIYTYICFILPSNIMIEKFGFLAKDVIYQNFLVSIASLLSAIIALFLCLKIHPLKMIKFTSIITLIFIPFLPHLLSNLSSKYELLSIQIFLSCFIPSSMPANAIFYKHFPKSKRFTYCGIIIALAKTFTACFTSLGIACMIVYFNNYYPLMLSILFWYICFYSSLKHFEYLEKLKNN
jgi:MFS family permease